jgi:hypothetical protein
MQVPSVRAKTEVSPIDLPTFRFIVPSNHHFISEQLRF